MKSERGQAMVEFALVLPILIVLFMGVVEFGRIYNSYLVITNASREGARMAVLGKSDEEIAARVELAAANLDPAALNTAVTPGPAQRKSGELATVEVRYDIPLAFPLFDAFLPDPLPIVSKTTMRVE
jgi:Flp pilus assembly protein TadG